MKGNVTLRWAFGAVSALAVIAVTAALAQQPDMNKSGHTYHVGELGSACTDCHTTAEESESASDRLIPGHDTCFECHDGLGAPDDCETCHSNVDEAIAEGVPARNVDHFPHAKHVAMGVECETCHTTVGTRSDGETMFGIPDMATCTTCHNGVKADIMCETCHTKSALGKLLPGSHMVPGWSQQHSSVARTEIETCTPCHVQEQDCDMCHRGANIMGIPHEEGFLDSHAFAFHAKQKECASCHDFESFCVTCHQQRRVFPANHSFASWLENHRDFAAMDLESCAACHDGSSPTCAQSGCHDGISD